MQGAVYNNDAIGVVRQRMLNNGQRCALGKCIVDMIVAVELLTDQCNEHIARFNQPCVGADACYRERSREMFSRWAKRCYKIGTGERCGVFHAGAKILTYRTSATRNRALRARGLRSTSCSDASIGFFVITVSCVVSRNVSFTIRSSSEW